MSKCKKGEPGPHHWVIEPSVSETSSGECQNCHWIKDFVNHSPGRTWNAENESEAFTRRERVKDTAARKAIEQQEQAEENLAYGDDDGTV